MVLQIRLTKAGWEDWTTGEPLGTWTNQADIVEGVEIFLLESDVIANTRAGDDVIFGSGGSGNGIQNSGTIKTGKGRDTISGGGRNFAISNSGTIKTGDGRDEITGSATFTGISNSGTIKTGNDRDKITGSALGFGISNSGMILTGNGGDVISGTSIGGSGIENSRIIYTGNGNDKVTGIGFDPFNGFGGDGNIYLGKGRDLITGFGQQKVNGGAGHDTAKFDFISDEVDISIISENSLVLTRSSEEMTFTNVEVFKFNDISFSFSRIDFDEGNLPAGTVITNQFEGLTISTPEKFGVMIFDTNNPTGGDHDLGAGVGNALIISEDGDSSDPDDNAAGGTISIKFDQLVTVTGIGLLDIDEEGGTIDFFDVDSNRIEVIKIPDFEDGNLQKLNPNVSDVARMDINLAGSGALTELNLFGSLNDSIIIDTGNELV